MSKLLLADFMRERERERERESLRSHFTFYAIQIMCMELKQIKIYRY